MFTVKKIIIFFFHTVLGEIVFLHLYSKIWIRIRLGLKIGSASGSGSQKRYQADIANASKLSSLYEALYAKNI
jgi:hypothetical protein